MNAKVKCNSANFSLSFSNANAFSKQLFTSSLKCASPLMLPAFSKYMTCVFRSVVIKANSLQALTTFVSCSRDIFTIGVPALTLASKSLTTFSKESPLIFFSFGASAVFVPHEAKINAEIAIKNNVLILCKISFCSL